VEQTEGYVAPGKEDWAWRLKKGLYGLVQAGRTWKEELNAHMESEGITATAKYPVIYVKTPWASDDFAAAGFWVDDCVAVGYGKELANLSKGVDAKYGITGAREVKWVLGMLLEPNRSVRTIADRELVGPLARLALGTSPDIAFATSSLARFGHDPGRVHWEVAKRVLVTPRGLRSASS